MGVFRRLWVFVGVCGCLWVFVNVCRCLWVFVGVCGCFKFSIKELFSSFKFKL